MNTDEAALIAFCKERMARYKVPKTIHFVADLPKTPQGKILRRELRKLRN
jgi:acyl-coenzyme A synthetase/AMP-(fatty) acid ligase